MTKIYGLLFLVPGQKIQIDKHCFGNCGKIQVGAIEDDQLGPMFACLQTDCPHKDTDMKNSIGDVDGDPVHIRKLKEK